ncbi:hypothetical protein N9478_10320 [Gammaproteobacteria bacterium]|nr:hypothetical protein [Gammaproteobacteria bacterium]
MSKDNKDIHLTAWKPIELPPHLQKARDSLTDKELVTQTLRDHITGDIDLISAQVQSANILAKASGMFTTRIEEVKTQLSSDELRDKLRESLLELKANVNGYYEVEKEECDKK